MPNVSGRIDHIAYDSVNQLAFVAALGNNTVEVVNINTKQVVHTITSLRAPQGVVYIYPLHRLVVANDDGGAVMFFDAQTYKLLHTIDLKDDADNMRYDDATNLLYVGYGSGNIAVIDVVGTRQIATIPLDGHPESFQLDKKRNRLYVNVQGADEIEVADLLSHTITAKWKNEKASSNFPLSLGEEGGKLFIGYRNPASLCIKDVETGNNLAVVSSTGDADDVFYNATDSLVYLSGGRGFIDVFSVYVPGQPERIDHIQTSNGARTSLLLPGGKTYLLAVPSRGSNEAELWVYKANGN